MNQSNELQSINNNYLTCPNFNHSLPSLAIMSNPNSDEQPQIVLPASSAACTQLSDANKAFDDVVFDILKVGPDEIAGQLTLIDLPLFKAIEPDELISCKWMSREKLIKAPNIVQFTRRCGLLLKWGNILVKGFLKENFKQLNDLKKIKTLRLVELSQKLNILIDLVLCYKRAKFWSKFFWNKKAKESF
ncbi:ras-specific guanine nucleotide-releasing factor 1 [Brachionus plicatilis]|uniref:Ras-specific guanine nucleotide-releasing factor 1 n=1 Tax=Brachionus plicatilis TaxID=10195 RepID=A0A3M7T4Z6_BRAPC|nr:ras-specific guanine nucleotide-releasing factor 1 [Brachionus plicatilis]